MQALDQLAYKLLGPGSSGVTLIAAALGFILLISLVSVLFHMVTSFRSTVNNVPSAPDTSRWLKKTGRPTMKGGSRRRVVDDDEERASYPEAPHRERRSCFRRQGNPIAVNIAEGPGSADVEQGWIIDRSTGGLCLEMERDLPEETMLRIRPVESPRTTPWVELEVRNCRQAKGSLYHVGCQFVRTPSWDVMLTFG